MATDEERLQILKMIEGGQITAEEGAKLLEALEEPSRAESRREGAPRWFRVRVTDLNTGKPKVNINLPFKLLDVGAKVGAKFAAPADLDIEEIVNAIKEGAEGKIVDVEDIEDGERVEVYVE
ncbi:MAG: hypothetical protein GTO63_09020 [Anaerolineae bacterium]|nr:hypothetical protein [Anaerolineae bacterium]NIN95029.1 hypothetical protein [Anaerolineae bacterium]NIQ78068.1 hypothetical protein [Anaerolineae bacterium]